MSNKEIETEKNSEKETSGTKENSTAKNILGTIAYIDGVCIFPWPRRRRNASVLY